MTITVKIDSSGPTGKRLLREIQKHPKVAKMEYPELITENKTYSMEEVFGKVEEKLNEHYGTNHKLKF